MEKITFTVEELKSLPADVLNKLLTFTEQAQTDVATAVDRKEQAINDYNQLETQFDLQKTQIREQATKIATLENEFITIKDHNDIFDCLEAHYETQLLEQKTETTRVDNLLFMHEEDNKKYRQEINELNADLQTKSKSVAYWKKQAEKSEATSNLLVRKLIETDHTTKIKQANIFNYFNNNGNDPSDKQIQEVIDTALNDNSVTIDKDGLYSPKK